MTRLNPDFRDILSSFAAEGVEYLVVGACADHFSVDDFTAGDLVLQLGVPPGRIDVITGIEGVVFDDAWANRLAVLIEGIPVTVLGREELIHNKRAVGRPQDRADVARLEAQRSPRS